MEREVILHGECALVNNAIIPHGAVRKNVTTPFIIVANSETTGNHHVVDMTEDMEVYEKDGRLYFKNSTPTQIRCVIADRHDVDTIEPGIWEVGRQREYDYYTASHRALAD